MSSHDVLSQTPREFAIMMRANVERKYDEYEDMAVQAMMHRQATNAKRLKKDDLFKRPKDEVVEKNKADKLMKQSEHATEWLSQFSLFDGKIS